VEGQVPETALVGEQVAAGPLVGLLVEHLDVLLVVASVVQVGLVQELCGVYCRVGETDARVGVHADCRVVGLHAGP